MQVNFDCRYYRGNRPCEFHKTSGNICADCQEFEKIEFRILIVKLAALGDVLRTTSILPALTRKYPQAAVTWITMNNAKPLLYNNEYIHRVLTIESNYLEFILNEEFDLGICLEADPLSAAILSLAKCKIKKGYIQTAAGFVIPNHSEAEEWFAMGVNDNLKRKNRKTYCEHIYQICGLAGKITPPLLHLYPKDEAFAASFSANYSLQQQKVLGINTGGGQRWQLKKWILEHYIQLIRLLAEANPSLKIILYGGPEEIEFNAKIIKSVPETVIDAGCLNSVGEFAALINLVDVFLTPDSLGMHISTALSKVTLVLVGPTSPWELNTFGKGEIIYYRKLDCISCYLNTCNKKVNCMNSLTPEFVFSRIQKYL